MTPAARIAAAIDLLEVIEGAPKRPADAVANDFFRSRRYIGSGDRRAVSERVWAVLRARRRLGWWLGETRQSARLLVAASLLTEGWTKSGVQSSYSGGQFAAAPLDRGEAGALARIEGHTLNHPTMPEAVLLEIPDWLLPRLTARFGTSLPAEMAALSEPAALDMRVNLLKGDREQARAALAAEGWEAEPTKLSPWGLRIDGRRPITSGPTFQTGLIEIQDEGSQLVAVMVGATPGMRVVDWCAASAERASTMSNAIWSRPATNG